MRQVYILMLSFLLHLQGESNQKLMVTEPYDQNSSCDSRNPTVEIISWEIMLAGKQVHATWKAANDAKIARYEVEKGGSPSAFSLLKSVASMRSPGTSTYGVIDRSLSRGWNYYRLKITDDDGNVTYTATKKIFIKEQTNWASVSGTDFIATIIAN
jgi:hypothetical protein